MFHIRCVELRTLMIVYCVQIVIKLDLIILCVSHTFYDFKEEKACIGKSIHDMSVCLCLARGFNEGHLFSNVGKSSMSTIDMNKKRLMYKINKLVSLK